MEHDYETDESAEVESVFLISAVRHDVGQPATVLYDSSSGMTTHLRIGLLAYVRTLLQENPLRAD